MVTCITFIYTHNTDTKPIMHTTHIIFFIENKSEAMLTLQFSMLC